MPWYEKRYLLDGLEWEGTLRYGQSRPSGPPTNPNTGRRMGTASAMRRRTVVAKKVNLPK